MCCGWSGHTISSLLQVATSVPLNSPLTFTVAALDANNLLATSYTGLVNFASTDGSATLPADSTLTGGMGTFVATFGTQASDTLIISDTDDGSIYGEATIGVGAAATNSATQLTIRVPSAAVAGTPILATVTALDSMNRISTGYTGTVQFTSSDGSAILPANTTLTDGVGTFQITLKTAVRGSTSTITATDTVTGTLTRHEWRYYGQPRCRQSLTAWCAHQNYYRQRL